MQHGLGFNSASKWCFSNPRWAQNSFSRDQLPALPLPCGFTRTTAAEQFSHWSFKANRYLCEVLSLKRAKFTCIVKSQCFYTTTTFFFPLVFTDTLVFLSPARKFFPPSASSRAYCSLSHLFRTGSAGIISTLENLWEWKSSARSVSSYLNTREWSTI